MLTEKQFNDHIREIGDLYEGIKEALMHLSLMFGDEHARLDISKKLQRMRNMACELAQANYPGFSTVNPHYEATEEELEKFFSIGVELFEDQGRYMISQKYIDLMKASNLFSPAQKDKFEIWAAAYVIKLNAKKNQSHEQIATHE